MYTSGPESTQTYNQIYTGTDNNIPVRYAQDSIRNLAELILKYRPHQDYIC